jgi:hypothetical protein
VLSNVGLKMTVNCSLAEIESLLLNGGLRKTTNRCLAEVVILLLSGGLRKTINQSDGLDDHKPNHACLSRSFVTIRLIGLRNLKPGCRSLMLFFPVKDKVKK